MMGLTSHLRIFLYLDPCDMRKSYNGLVALADQLVGDGLKSGALFLFTSEVLLILDIFSRKIIALISW
jgi:transposase